MKGKKLIHILTALAYLRAYVHRGLRIVDAGKDKL